MQVIFTTVLFRNQRNTVQALAQVNVGLEKTVVSRTSDLQIAKENLEKLIQTRTAELKEVESLNKMMVDRELKMIELKKENETLKSKLQTA